MRKFGYSVLILLTAFVILTLSACKNKTNEYKQNNQEVISKPAVIGDETTMLLKYLEESGDYVNSKEFPSLIKASVVKESLENNILVIDLRPDSEFSKGHIKGAVNIQFTGLPDFLEKNIKPFEYDKLILVCEDGQVSSYTASLLRLMGYGNVFAMRWGMSSWNKDYAADGWLKGVSGKYESSLEVTVNEKPSPFAMPELKTGMTSGESVADFRFNKLFSEGVGNILISSDEVFKNPQHFFIINLERKDKYEDGHVPGAVRFKPEATLGFTGEMASIPFDRRVVVYCGTGHNSGFATAYLRLLGYDARTLKYGNNGFMHDKMVKQKTALSWLPFSADDINDFDVVK